MKKKGKGKVQGVLESQTAALLKHQEIALHLYNPIKLELLIIGNSSEHKY